MLGKRRPNVFFRRPRENQGSSREIAIKKTSARGEKKGLSVGTIRGHEGKNTSWGGVTPGTLKTEKERGMKVLRCSASAGGKAEKEMQEGKNGRAKIGEVQKRRGRTAQKDPPAELRKQRKTARNSGEK